VGAALITLPRQGLIAEPYRIFVRTHTTADPVMNAETRDVLENSQPALSKLAIRAQISIKANRRSLGYASG